MRTRAILTRRGCCWLRPSRIPLHRTTRIAVEGEPPSPLHPPPGCRFHTRCVLASERCRVEEPLLQDIGSGHLVACHHHDQAYWPPRSAEVVM